MPPNGYANAKNNRRAKQYVIYDGHDAVPGVQHKRKARSARHARRQRVRSYAELARVWSPNQRRAPVRVEPPDVIPRPNTPHAVAPLGAIARVRGGSLDTAGR